MRKSIMLPGAVSVCLVAVLGAGCGGESGGKADGGGSAGTNGEAGAGQSGGGAGGAAGRGTGGRAGGGGQLGSAGSGGMGTGGTGGRGGTGAGGRGGTGAGGRGGAGGSAGSGGGSMSSGCGVAATGTSSYVRQTIMVGTNQREYYIYVPRTYSATRAYPLVFRWHGATGNGISGGLEIEAASKEDAIIASPSGIGGNWDTGRTGVDVQLFDALLTSLEGSYCIDTGRIFSYGFSAGAAFTNLLGCLRGDVLRAVAPVEGLAPQTTNCTGPIAAWITHSPDDQTITIDKGAAARDLFLGLDGCASTTMPVAPSPCVRYDGCGANPVDWCVTSGPHNPQGAFTGPGSWNFFNSLL